LPTLVDLHSALADLEQRAPVPRSTTRCSSSRSTGQSAADIELPDHRASWRWATRVGLTVWMLTRIAFLGLAAIVVHTVPAAQHRNPGLPGLGWPVQIYNDFDSGWFLTIAAHGYFPATDRSALTPAFLPGYPLASRFTADLLGLGTPTRADYFAALGLISLLGSAIAAILLGQLTSEVASSDAAVAAVAVLLAGPYSVFLMASYSESLFLALGLGAWIGARHHHWGLAGALAAAATVVRINGLFLDAGLAVMLVQHCRTTDTKPRAAHTAALTFAPLALLGYFAWLHQRTGSWGTWFTAQRQGWGRTTVWPTTAFINSIHRIVNTNGAVRYQSILEVVFAAGFITATAVLARRQDWAAASYVGLTAASLLTSHHYLSVPRAMLTCFPIAILVAEVMTARRRAPMTWLATLAGLGLLAANATTFLTGQWTG